MTCPAACKLLFTISPCTVFRLVIITSITDSPGCPPRSRHARSKSAGSHSSCIPPSFPTAQDHSKPSLHRSTTECENRKREYISLWPSSIPLNGCEAVIVSSVPHIWENSLSKLREIDFAVWVTYGRSREPNRLPGEWSIEDAFEIEEYRNRKMHT